MQTSPNARKIISHYEGFRAKAYKCPAGVWTIGYGHTGRDVKPGMVWDMTRALVMLDADIDTFERDVTYLLSLHPQGTSSKMVTQAQFDALVSFAFNCGSDIDQDTKAEGLGDSTLLKHHKAGRFDAAEKAFHSWIYGGGKKLPGLVKRRKSEADLYAGRGVVLH
jgi:lysozyme